MASGGIFLATEQGDLAGPYLHLQPVYTIQERSGTLDERVVYPALRVVELLTFGSPAKLPTQKQVRDPVSRQDGFDGAGVEVRRVPGVRSRAGVHQYLDTVLL